jgi:hypothetical protein
MTFLYCQSFYFDFEVTVFAKDYEKYADKMKVNSIVIVN